MTNNNQEHTPLIDLDQILINKWGQIYQRIPTFLINWVKRLIHQDDINYLIRRIGLLKGGAAAKVILDELSVTYEVVGEDNIPLTASSSFTFVSNHPLGGLDGIAFIDYLGKKYNDKAKLLVNDILLNLKMFDNVFVPINKFGKQAKEGVRMINEAYSSENPVFTFPAGIVSRMQKNGRIEDPKWTKNFIQKSVENNRTIIPVYFEGSNAPFFYRIERIRMMLGIKFNIGTLLLPKVLFKNRGSHFKIYIGKSISCTTFDASKTNEEWADWVKRNVYQLASNNEWNK